MFDPNNTRYPLLDRQNMPVPHERVVEVLATAEHAIGAADALNCHVNALRWYCVRAGLTLPPSYAKTVKRRRVRSTLGRLFDQSGEKDKLAWLERLIDQHGSAQAVEREYGLAQGAISHALRRLRMKRLKNDAS